MRILVVEDNKEVARQIMTALEQELFVVDVAYDGEEGWYLGDTESYDTVIIVQGNGPNCFHRNEHKRFLRSSELSF